jgi:hypothetical protein
MEFMPILNLLLSTAILASTTLRTHQNVPKAAPEERSVLSETVESFRVENSTMEAALRSLRQTDFARILIGFERIARRQSEKTESLSLSLSNATVGQILDQLCQQSHEYTYQLIDGAIIHVHPVHAESDPPGLLNMKVRDFSIEGKMLPAAIIQRISVLVPELEAYLAEKRNAYYAGRGIMPASPGAILGGNMDPTVSLHLHDLTVRQILGNVILYSVQLRNQMPPDSHGYKLPTASWMYEFVIDPNAPTGLGGTPRWIAF